MTWETDRVALEFYRPDADPKAFDVEYTVEYHLRFRYDEDTDDYDAEADGPYTVTYSPGGDEKDVPIAWADLTPETRATFETMIKADAKTQARELGGRGSRWGAGHDDDDSAYETWRDR